MAASYLRMEYPREEEEEEEDAEALKCRPPRAQTQMATALDHHAEEAEQLESEKSIYLDPNDGTWKCHHCTWTYPTASSGTDDIKAHCHRLMNVSKTTVPTGIHFNLESKGTKSADGTGGMSYSATGHSIAEEEPGNEESVFKLNDIDMPKSLATDSSNGSDGMKNSVPGHSVVEEEGGKSDFILNKFDIPKSFSIDSNNEISRMEYVVGNFVAKEKLRNGESDFTPNGVDSQKTRVTESTNGASGMKCVVSHPVAKEKLENWESDFTLNDSEILTESTNVSGGMKFGVLGHSVGEKKLGNGESDYTLSGVEFLKNVGTETNHQSHKDLEEEQSGLQFMHSLKSSENEIVSHMADNNSQNRLMEESKQEVAEWDVKRVLGEQETHDLYCPNCNSCITKRVILRKRKRKVQNLQYDLKREKIEVVQSSAYGTVDQTHNTTLPALDDSSSSVNTADQDHVTEPDLFRCLSCFSFFIPSVASFKSFRIFGGRGQRGSEIAQSLQQTPVSTGAVEQGRDVVQHVEVIAISELKSQYPPIHQSDQVPIVKAIPNQSIVQTENDAALEPQEDGKNLVVTSTTSVKLEIVKTDVEQIPYGAVIKNREGGTFAGDNNATSTSLPTSNPLPDANEQVNISTNKLLNDEQTGQVSTGQVSSMSVSIHLVENRTATDDKYNDASKRIERDAGYDVTHDRSSGEVINPAPHLDKNLPSESSNFILNDLGAQFPGISTEKLEEVHKLISSKEGKDIPVISNLEVLPPQDKHIGIGKDLEGPPMSIAAGKDLIIQIEAEQNGSEVSQRVQNSLDESTPGILTYRETEYRVSQQVDEDRTPNNWDILKSIVYGGLVESITSLSVVSSASGADATTLNIVALGFASLFGGLFIFAHGLMDLRNEQYRAATDENKKDDRYQELLGKRTRFRLHAVVALVSYMLFGLVAPITYGFSFRKSDKVEYKLIAVAAASLVCIGLLAIAKSYVQRPPKAYFKTVLYYVSIGVAASGLSYVTGVLILKLLERFGLFETIIEPVPSPSAFFVPITVKPAWASY